MGLPVRDQNHSTYRDYCQWSDEHRWELIDGVAYMMAPAPLVEHQQVAGAIFRQLGNALEGHPCLALIAPVDVRLPAAHEADDDVATVVQPDVLVVCDPAKIDRRGVRGAPDLVVEVLSPSTASHDHVMKRQVYERAGVREYWLVHPTDRVLWVYHLADGKYGAPHVQALEGQTAVGVLSGVAIAWAPITERLPPIET